MCYVSSDEETSPHIHCSPLSSGELPPSRFPHLYAWVHEHYRELQVLIDDDRPADFCGMYTLKVHTEGRPFVCGQNGCNKSFASSGNLIAHKRIHTGNRPFLCDHDGCNKRFARSVDLTTHKRSHTGDKPYTCDFDGCN
ncbi:C2H2-type zinc finger protein, partial [Sansalvadorimonas verongulae]|nr:C2H2-type zinc finger protein [Sansalvadorimonas verongulae]